MRVLETYSPPIVAIDAGTAVTRLCSSRSGILERRSVIEEVVDGEHHHRATMSGGVISDIAGEAAVISQMLRLARIDSATRPNAVVCTPSDTTSDEREALVEAVIEAGANVVQVIPEPLAAAVGIGVGTHPEHASMLVDIGDGVTDIAIIREQSIVTASALRVGCGDLRRSVQQWLEWHYDLSLGDDDADGIVRAYFNGERETIVVPSPAHSNLLLSPDDVGAVLDPVADAIAGFVESTFFHLPDELASEVVASGIHLSGGGSRLRELVADISRRLHTTPRLAHDPLNSVIFGARAMMVRAQRLGVRP